MEKYQLPAYMKQLLQADNSPLEEFQRIQVIVHKEVLKESFRGVVIW